MSIELHTISKWFGPVLAVYHVSFTVGARYQWITSTTTNDAVEAAIYATYTYYFY